MRLIDADELRDEILHNEYGFDNDIVNYYLDVIDLQPTINAKEEIHAQWVTDLEGLPYCSCCTEYTLAGFTATHQIVKSMKFCPNCGAIMDEAIVKTNANVGHKN